MSLFRLPFSFPDIAIQPVQGYLELAEPLPYLDPSGGSGFYLKKKEANHGVFRIAVKKKVCSKIY